MLESAKDPEHSFDGSDFGITKSYAGAGKKHKAFEHLEKSFPQREWNFARLWESPELDSLRDDPRYQILVSTGRTDVTS